MIAFGSASTTQYSLCPLGHARYTKVAREKLVLDKIYYNDAETWLPAAPVPVTWATHLSRYIFKDFYVDN